MGGPLNFVSLSYLFNKEMETLEKRKMFSCCCIIERMSYVCVIVPASSCYRSTPKQLAGSITQCNKTIECDSKNIHQNGSAPPPKKSGKHNKLCNLKTIRLDHKNQSILGLLLSKLMMSYYYSKEYIYFHLCVCLLFLVVLRVFF